MLHRPQSGDRSKRGQALVEFALVLPILALLLVMAIDFGRVFFGWVSLTNASRIGANYAGYTPDLLSNPSERDEYEQLIADAVTGCSLAPADLDDSAYDPTFTDTNGDGKDNGWGDHVTVTIACQLDLITPLAGAIVGQVVPMRAESVFPIREGSFIGPGGGGTSPNPPCTQSRVPDLINRTVAGARQKWVDEGFLAANFSPPPGPNEDYIVTSQVFTPPANILDCVDPAIQQVTITSTPPPPCPAGQAQVPDLVGQLVSEAKTTWSASFSGAFKPNNAVNTKTVLSQVVDPNTPINACAPVSASVTVTWGDPPAPPCDVPNMIGKTYAQAQSLWTANGFTKSLKHQGNQSKPVAEQTPTHPGTVSCDVDGTVKLQ